MMIKYIPAGSQTFDEPISQLIKVSSSGLRGNDLRTLIKRAGHSFADAFQNMDLKSGEVPIHLIALGATEFYGPNRNGDGFKEATCKKYHSTFVKYARFYRNHKNKDPKESYGIIKLSKYNDPMHRIELLVALNKTKEAAERNGGFVADEELEKLARGEDIGVSMACRVPFDICAGCGNQARTIKEYCKGTDEGGLCKRGGVANRMTFVHDDGFINHVDNTEPSWFDMSRVWRPADRIAWTSGIMKAAGTNLNIGGAELAEKMGIQLPYEMMVGNDDISQSLLNLTIKLASIEDDLEKNGSDRMTLAFSPVIQTQHDWTDHKATSEQAFSALSQAGICMSLGGFAQLTKGASALSYVDMSAKFLPGIYNRMLSDGSLANFESSKYLPNVVVPNAMRSWAEKQAADYSFRKGHVESRIRRACMYHTGPMLLKKGCQIRTACEAESLARNYALYKLAFLRSLDRQSEDFDLTVGMVVRQNYL